MSLSDESITMYPMVRSHNRYYPEEKLKEVIKTLKGILIDPTIKINEIKTILLIDKLFGKRLTSQSDEKEKSK